MGNHPLKRIPAWAAQLPRSLRPSGPAIKHLERVRRRLRLSHDFFLEYVARHAETTRRQLDRAYHKLRSSMSETDARGLLLAIRMALHIQGMLPGAGDPFGLRACPEAQRTRRIKEIAERHPTVEALIDSIIEEEAREAVRAGTAPPSSSGVAPAALEIARILKDNAAR